MQSLISQIANLFATQSLNSLDNNELTSYSAASSEFGGVLESFTGGNDAANFAALDGKSLPVTHSPISFQVAQFALTAQPSMDEGAIEYSGEIVSVQGDINFQNMTSAKNLNAYRQQDQGYDSTYSANYDNQVAVTHQSLENGQNIVSPLLADQIDTNVSTRYNLNNLTTELTSRYQVISHSQQDINVESENITDSRSLLRNINESGSHDYEFQNHKNTIIKDQLFSNNIGDSSINETVIKDSAIANNIATYVKPLEQALSAYSVTSIDEKQNKTFVNSNALLTDNKTSVDNDLNVSTKVNITGLNTLISDDNSVDKPILSNNELDYKIASADNPNISNPLIKNQVINTESQQVRPEDLPIDNLEVTTAKQIYNPLQQDEIKRIDYNTREDNTSTRSNGYNQETLFDNVNRAVNRNDVGIDLSSAFKSQDILQDVKFTSHNMAIDKANIQMPVLSEQLTVSNRVTSLDRSPLLLDARNVVANGDDLAQQIVWAKNSNIQNIKISITPEHLGALEINIESDSDGLNIQFVTQNATSKDALETFMPRLKDMLEQSGLNLQNANVSQQDKGQSGNSDYRDSDQFVSQSGSDDHNNVNNNSEHIDSSVQANSRLLEAFA